MNKEFNNGSIWVFHGEQGRFSSGVFTSQQIAEEWIKKHKLSGLLTEYPLNKGVYDWALENDLFSIKKDSHKSSQFIQGFTSGSQEHFHYEYGELI
ncbi:hypothetical protein [Mucilaginibacter sp. BT774]|uniref:DUF7710 domain-containing protein n=1 Tax=Mucilaginibacter sp. BT774 TaxID=3062276 RepID=UPI002676CC10|nr:hypothetical protein [Mucilaginibacter sp. BT774]MDO3627653.1 hypothetical protein [Mucilaginibacter sp. BT774]